MAILFAVAVGGAVYYQSLRASPQYSLALLIDAAKRDDLDQVDALVDIDAVVDDFIPQITGKAIELYGRGQSHDTLTRVEHLATPILPAVKERAGAELPRVIRERTKRFGYVPFFAMVLGAERYLDVAITGDTAIVTSKLPDHPLQMMMRRNGEHWQIIAVTDEQVATDIARKIGQEIIAIVTTGSIKDAAEKFGVGNMSDLLRQAEELVR